MKTQIIQKIVLLLLSGILVFCQCSLLGDVDPPNVVSFTPANRSINVDQTTGITIQFSEPMDEPISEKAFSLTYKDNSVNGYFKWQENSRKLIFIPEYPLPKAQIYTVTLSKDAEDKNSNNLDKELNFQFTVGGETVKPYVVSTYPSYGAMGIPKEANISVTFSEPVDLDSVINGISFSPSFQYQLTFNNNTATFNPDGLLEYGTTYNVNCSTTIEDTEGNALMQVYAFTFTIGNDFTSPTLVSAQHSSAITPWVIGIINNTVEKDDSLIFDFSKPMDKVNTGTYFTFSPTVDGSFFWNTDYQVQFTPTTIFDLTEIYTVTISDSLSDTNGNQLDNQYYCIFCINGTNSTPPQVDKISDTINDPWVENQFIVMNPDQTYTNIRIHFSRPMQRTPTMTRVSVEYVYGSGSGINLEITDYIWNITDDILRIDIQGLEAGNNYMLKITAGEDGVKDKKNNYMLEDFIIHFET